MKIERITHQSIESRLFKGKTIIVTGPRQVGKTTLINSILEKQKNFLFLNGDDTFVRQKLSSINTSEIKQIIGNNHIVFIDEAQKINDIGNTAKIINDQFNMCN